MLRSFGTSMASPRNCGELQQSHSQLPAEVGPIGPTELFKEIMLSIVDGEWCFLACFLATAHLDHIKLIILFH